MTWNDYDVDFDGGDDDDNDENCGGDDPNDYHGDDNITMIVRFAK